MVSATKEVSPLCLFVKSFSSQLGNNESVSRKSYILIVFKYSEGHLSREQDDDPKS